VLFLDALTLYKRDALEALRGPLEDGVVRIARSAGTISFPCRFSLVAA
jgi:magnesium chelatase family protein